MMSIVPERTASAIVSGLVKRPTAAIGFLVAPRTASRYSRSAYSPTKREALASSPAHSAADQPPACRSQKSTRWSASSMKP